MEIKRYRCIKEFIAEAYDGSGFFIESRYFFVKPGSIWQESNCLIAGGSDNVHLDREDDKPNKGEWCEPLKETLKEYFEQIESIYA